jgi:hypothetical protein
MMSCDLAAEVPPLPPMVVTHHAPEQSSDEPAGRREQDPGPLACGEAGASTRGSSGSPQSADSSSHKQVPLLPSIKESMPFLSELSDSSIVAAGQDGGPAGAEPMTAPTRERAPCGHGTPSLAGAAAPREIIPALLPASATTSTNSSPSVCPQRPPTYDPARVNLKAPRSDQSSSTPEKEGPDRVGGLDWGERRKRARREQIFQSASPRVQRVEHLKLIVSKLMAALPLEERKAFLEGTKR